MDGTKDIHRALAHGWMDFGPDIYGERRDIEQERSGCEMSAGVIAVESHAGPGKLPEGDRQTIIRGLQHASRSHQHKSAVY